MLHGHTRAITQIKYNREGDLLFSAAKDHTPNVWFSINGERLGDTTKFLSGSGDNTCKLWDCSTGKCIETFDTETSVRSVGFSYSGNMIMFTTDQAMRKPCECFIYDCRDGSQISQEKPAVQITIPQTQNKITSALWGALDEYLIFGHEKGELSQWDIKNVEEVITKYEDHRDKVNDLQLSKDGSMLISSSKDTYAKLFDAATLNHMKTYKTSRPVNSAAISPVNSHVVLGGGQEAMEVTQTAKQSGKFEARFYHLIFEEEFGRVKGHFGPINSLAFNPNGEEYSSGAEDGYVRVHTFDQSYFDFDFDY
ncbi:EIF3I [Bugula neritina]|uniref:Eukaryotic translation initiation factor 3 subunit I n=1 Tax=Bugula neritina TaxID=10212 RepID=A0A7J7JWU9_BUGNE|nr:EIF3I [Bugula neritina]